MLPLAGCNSLHPILTWRTRMTSDYCLRCLSVDVATWLPLAPVVWFIVACIYSELKKELRRRRAWKKESLEEGVE